MSLVDDEERKLLFDRLDEKLLEIQRQVLELNSSVGKTALTKAAAEMEGSGRGFIHRDEVVKWLRGFAERWPEV